MFCILLSWVEEKARGKTFAFNSRKEAREVRFNLYFPFAHVAQLKVP